MARTANTAIGHLYARARRVVNPDGPIVRFRVPALIVAPTAAATASAPSPVVTGV